MNTPSARLEPQALHEMSADMSIPVSADAAEQLEQRLSADQAERTRRQASWERRLALVRRCQRTDASDPIPTVAALGVSALFIIAGLLRGKISMGWAGPCIVLAQVGFRLLARVAERRILVLAKREGIDLPSRAEGGPG